MSAATILARGAFVAAISVVFGGCYVRSDHDEEHYSSPSPEPPEIVEATIDRGAELDVVPGDGAGAFVEYGGDGVWRVSVTCDTNLSGFECAWDVVLSSSSALVASQGEDLEGDDLLYEPSRRAVALQTYTGSDFDAMVFEFEPGDGVRLEAWLDSVPAPRFVYWIGDGGLHRGAPSLPLDLVPSAP